MDDFHGYNGYGMNGFEFENNQFFIGDRFFKYRPSYMPFYDEHADYNTNAKSYYDYLARFNAFLSSLTDQTNRLLRRNIKVIDTKSIDLSKSGDWIDNGKCGAYDDVISLQADVIISEETETKKYDNIEPKTFTVPNGSKIKNTGLWSPDYASVLDGIDDEIGDIDGEISDLKKRVSTLENTVNNQGATIAKLENALKKIVQNLFNSGGVSSEDIYSYNFNSGRNIATGNINLFGGSQDGSSFIRTNNGKTENDLTGGL